MTYDIAALAEQIAQSPKLCGNVTLVTIDGPAGSGKTTLANALERQVPQAQVIAMDGLYNGWTRAFEPQLWDRIEQVILQPFTQGQVAEYDAFNWSTQEFDMPVQFEPTGVVILEGVGSSHPTVKPFSSLNIWISAPEALLLDRVLDRDGRHIREQMLDWQIAEREYFKQFDIESQADIHLLGN